MNQSTPKLNFEVINQDLSLPETDWKIREEHLQALLKRLPEVIANPTTLESFCDLARPLAQQFADLRSVIVKLASDIVQDFSSLTKRNNHPKVFAFTNELLRDSNFIKALGSGNKVIARHVHAALQSMIVRERLSFETLVEFFNNCSTSKIIAVRERVAEAVLGFIMAANKARPGQGSPQSNVNGNGFKEKSETFEQIIAKSRPQSSAKNALPITQDDRPKSKVNQVDFYQKAAELFIKDAAANVRGTAKLIKAELICLAQFDFSQSIKEVSRTKPTRADSRSISRRENVSIERTSSSYKQIKAKPMSAQVIPVETMVSEKPNVRPYRKNPGVSKPTSSRGIIESVSFLIDSALKTLNDSQSTIQDKVMEVSRILSHESKFIVIELQQYIDFMRHLDTTKSPQLHEALSKLLTSVDIRMIQEDLFNKICSKRWIKRPNMTVVVNLVAQKMGFIHLLDAFIGHMFDDVVVLLDRNFSIEEFDLLVAENPDVVKPLIHRISENVIEGKCVSESLSLLEKLMQVKLVIEHCIKNELDQPLMDILEESNPSLFKFLMIKQGKPLPSSKKSMKNEDKMSVQSETSKIHDLMSKANLVTRKNILRSIVGHVAKLGLPDVQNSTRTKIAAKTIEILNCLSENSESADEETILLAFDVLDKLVLVSLNVTQLNGLFDATSRIFDVHQSKFYTEQAERLLEFIYLEPRYLLSIVLKAEKADIESLNLLTFIFRQLKTFPHKSEILAKTKSIIDDFLLSIRSFLICHSDIQIRKLTVGMLVQLYISLGPKKAAEISSTFAPEQQTLINVYMKKALL